MKVDKKIKSKKYNWSFNKEVSKSFDDHVKKSVPFYEISHNLITSFSSFFLSENSVCYDFGCSTGTLLNKIKKKNKDKKLKLIGIDNSKSMIQIAKKRNKDIYFKYGDVLNQKLLKSDLSLCLYTLQFLKPKERQKFINKIYNSLNWGGGLILYEKIRGADARFQDMLNFLYFDYKKENGLSALEILNKENSLRSVMEPYTISANIDFLKRAGFKDIMPISQYLCFIGFLAIK